METLIGLLGQETAATVTAWAGVAAAFVLFFDRLAKLTPTYSDNKIVAYAYKVFAVLGLKVPDIK